MSTHPLSVETPALAPLHRSPRSLPAHTGTWVAAGSLSGAAGGAATGLASLGQLGLATLGPVGIAVGALGGAVVGALAGKGLAEARTAPTEADFWREEHPRQPFAAGRPFEDFMEAYRIGYQGPGHHPRRSFSEVEQALRLEYEEGESARRLSWDEARPAVVAAWDRISHAERDVMGFTVLDAGNASVGQVHTVWQDDEERPHFAGVTTTWVMGKVHLIPLRDAVIAAPDRVLRLPYSSAQIQASPTLDPGDTLAVEEQQRALQHFGLPGAGA